jgi:predicted transcriptional regulator
MKQKKYIFLSFRPEFFRPILYDIKKYEYRKRFCNEPTCAYLYLSSPVKKVIGIMQLGKPILMDQIIENYNVNSVIYSRIKSCLNGGEKFAIPIESFTLFKTPIGIEKLKELDEHFVAPQCYLNLENYPTIFNYLKNQDCYDVEFLNTHNQIYEDNFAMTCKEMEQTEEFNRKDKLYTSQKKYSIIECGYITKKLRR